jgi:hypothetical protein
MKRSVYRTRAMTCLAAVLLTGLSAAERASAADLHPTDLDVSDAQDYLGKWTLSMNLLGSPATVSLQLLDADGKMAGYAVTSFDPMPSVIDAMRMTDEGLVMEFGLSLGAQDYTVHVTAALAGDALTGTFAETNGLATAEFTGKRGGPDLQQKAAEAENSNGSGRKRNYGREIESEVGGHAIKVRFAPLDTDSKDYKNFTALKPGQVFLYVGGRAVKLFTDSDLVFGDTVIKTENAAKNYPGVYSLWLKRTESGWDLVFNQDSDIWGSQYLASADVAEIPLKTATLDEPQKEFAVEILAKDSGGTLRFTWGDTEWTAPFRLGEHAIEHSLSGPQTPPGSDAAPSGGGETATLVGTWHLKGDSPFGELAHTLIVKPDGTAEYLSGGERADVRNLKVENGKVTFDMQVFAGDARSYMVSFAGTVNDEELTGDILASGNSFSTLTAPRE